MKVWRAILCAGVLSFALPSHAAVRTDKTDPPIVYTTYVYGEDSAASEIFTVSPGGGSTARLTDDDEFDLEPEWSPDRSRIAYVHHARPRNPDIWVMDADGSDKRRLTRGPRDDGSPRWSPDGTRIAWVKTRADTPWGEIHLMEPDGSGKASLVRNAAWPQWSPDGTRISYMHRRSCRRCRRDWEIRVIEVASGRVVELTRNGVDDIGAMWSPEGDRLVYTRRRPDGGGVLVVVFGDGSERRRLTDVEDYAYAPEWSPDGSEIAFSLLVDVADFETRLAVVDVATKERRLLTDVEIGGLSPKWSPDGDRIAFLGFHDGNQEIDVVGRDGTGRERLTESRGDEGSFDW